MSDTDSEGFYPADGEARRLKSILYNSKKPKKPGPYSLAVDFQKLDKDAREFVDRVGDNMVVEVPKALNEVCLAPNLDQGLDIKSHEAYLTEQTSLVIEERKREIQSTQKRLEKSLRELAIVKRKEEETLKRKVTELQRDFTETMKELQKQFIAQADDVREEALTKLAQQRSQCEMAVESKARALSATLATGTRACSPPYSPRGHRSGHPRTPMDEGGLYSDPNPGTDTPVAVHRYPPQGTPRRLESSPPLVIAKASPDNRRRSFSQQEATKEASKHRESGLTPRGQRSHRPSSSHKPRGIYSSDGHARSDGAKRRDLLHLLDSDDDDL
ncbi:hypothetical protein BSKO_08171 [Bryopsis sp. KO-2023]|nr:hypothetical protein BSKO_08171 [Bryopsis sp. KO-2023]